MVAYIVLGFLILCVVLAIIFFGVHALIDVAGDVGFFVKKPMQGRFIAIMRGETLVKIIYSIKGWVLDEATGNMVEGDRPIGWFENLFGSQWIGRPFTFNVFRFKLSWDEFGKKEGVDGQSIISIVDQDVESLFFEHTYALVLKKAESAGNIPLNMTAQITLRRLNPARTMFKQGTPKKTFETTIGLALNSGREVLREMYIDEILGLGDNPDGSTKKVSNLPKESKQKIIQRIFDLNQHSDLRDVDAGEGSGPLVELTGYQIIAVAIETVDPDLPQEKLDLLSAPALAKKRAEETIISAEATKKADILKGEGRAGALAAEARAMGRLKHAAHLRELQALEKSKLLTTGGKGLNIFASAEREDPNPDPE